MNIEGIRRFVTVTVTDADGVKERAMLFQCPCGGVKFIVLEIKTHIHLQCCECDVSYCQGDCVA